MTTVPRFLPTIRTVVVLVPPGSQLIGLIGFLEALDAANRFRAHRDLAPLYDVKLVGVAAQTPSAAGPVLSTTLSSSVTAAHTLVVGGGFASAEAEPDPRVLAEVTRLAEGAERLVSICMGAFVFAALGMLDGRRCTTHWLALEQLRTRYPAAKVEADAIFTEDGPILTSAGATAGIDLALHLVRIDGGSRLALAVARGLVVFAQRPGGQSQFGSAVRLRSGLDDRLRGLVGRVLSDPGADHAVASMAQSVGMSPRNFARVFREQAGETPAAFVARVRVEAAQQALAHGDEPAAVIAEDCGFGCVETMRRSFLRVAGVSPAAYRQRFRLQRSPAARRL